MFSKACEYGIRAAIYIAHQSLQGKKVSLKKVAESIDSPVAYTSKILQTLVKNKVIISEKGPTGGFSIHTSNINKISLSNVVVAIDGDSLFKGCGLGLRQCNEHKPCPVHHQFKIVRNGLKQMLETTTLISLSSKIEEGNSYLKL